MLIVVIMGKWIQGCGLMIVCVVVWCLALWFVFSVMWSELLMTSAISCPLW